MPNSGSVPLGANTVPDRLVGGMPILAQFTTWHSRPVQVLPLTHRPSLVHLSPAAHSPPPGVHSAPQWLVVVSQWKPAGQVFIALGLHACMQAGGRGIFMH